MTAGAPPPTSPPCAASICPPGAAGWYSPKSWPPSPSASASRSSSSDPHSPGPARCLRAAGGLRELALARGLAPEPRRVAQARLLRRLVRTLKGEEAARARGPAWAETLDATFATDFFRNGPGRPSPRVCIGVPVPSTRTRSIAA